MCRRGEGEEGSRGETRRKCIYMYRERERGYRGAKEGEKRRRVKT